MISVLDIVSIIILLLFGVGGLISGLIGKIGKLFSFFISISLAFFIASPINGALLNNGAYSSIIEAFDGNQQLAGIVMLAVIFFIVFIVTYLLVWLIFKTIKKLVHSLKVLAFIDKLLGLLIGLAIGLVMISIMFIVIGQLGNVNEDILVWLNEDLSKSFGLASKLFEFANWSIGQLSTVVDGMILIK